MSFLIEKCPRCFMDFGITPKYKNKVTIHSLPIYCPVGHPFWYEKKEKKKLVFRIKK